MIIPAIDIMKGSVVQLRKGRRKLFECSSWRERLNIWSRMGEVAVIDLDAARGVGRNSNLIEEILALAHVRLGGGIRLVEDAERMLRRGAKRVLLSSAIFSEGRIDGKFIERLLKRIPAERIIFALDSDKDAVMIHGWREKSGIGLEEALQELRKHNVGFLVTFIEGEGCLRGLPLKKIERLRKITDNYLVVAGGVSGREEVLICDRLGIDVQAGVALYTGRIDPLDIFLSSLQWRGELLPVIVQDCWGQILTLAYGNRKSIERSISSGFVWHYSRSRQELWCKGSTSGNSQRLLRVLPDCDRDTLIYVVAPAGSACHSGRYSCFAEKSFFLPELLQIVSQRIKDAPRGSYTASLSLEKRRKKLLEEAVEVILAKDGEHLVWEAADLLYFLTTIMAEKGVTYEQVLSELQRRRM